VKIVVVEALPEGISKEIHDIILIKQGLNPGIHIGSLVIVGNSVLRERNDFSTILFHVVIGHNVFSEVQLDQKERALIVLDLIEKHGYLF
jgi:hypothetical protein